MDPHNTPSCSKRIEKTNVTEKDNNKRKIENQQENKNVKNEVETPNGSSREDSVKIDTVSEYAKRSRLDFNFWDNVTNPSNNAKERVFEIKDLKTGNCFGKPLKIRITYKSNVRPGGSGQVFNVHAMDASSEIGMVCFGHDGTRFNEELKINMVYYLENFIVEPENVLYPSGTGNALQIKLRGKSKFQLVSDSNFPKIVFNFVSISTITSLSYNDKVDVMGILVKNNGLETTYRSTPKRDVALTDKSKETIFLTLWGVDATKFDVKLFSVVVIKRGYIAEIEGNNKISCLFGTLVWCNPRTPEAIELEKWFNEEQLKMKHK